MSDIHIELTRGWDLAPVAERPAFDVLVMAGDLLPRMERVGRWLVDRVPDKPVIYVAGNHEAYAGDETRTVEKAAQAAAGTNVHVLQNRTITLEDQKGKVTFAGATMWTDFDLHGDQHRAMTVANDRMKDFRKIRTDGYRRRFWPHHALARHWESRASLEAEMRKPREPGHRLVVVTHHSPLPGSPDERPDPASWLSDEEILDAAFRSDLTDLMTSQRAAASLCGRRTSGCSAIPTNPFVR
ncbi:metallophosphoesterase [Bradyrhizobium elkanii]|uniref:metallophosphoesterase n=1 Tax=Bradyrhizobium elkanii TaxID=29448 RepID=UPI003519B5AF